MKNMKNYLKYMTLALTMVIVSTSFFSCQKEEGEDVPVIKNVRVVEKDSSIQMTSLGKVIAIQGTGLKDVQKIFFNKIEAELNPNYVTSSNIIVTVPNVFPEEISNQIVLITASKKEYNFDFVVDVPKPTLTKTEFAFGKTGNTLTLTGANFAQIKTVTVGPKEVTNYEISKDFKTMKIIMPTGVPASVIKIKVDAVAGSVETDFDLAAASMPAIKSVSNEYAPAGKKIRLMGSNFANLLYVKLNGIAATGIVEADDYSYAEFVVPSGVNPGVATITAANEYGVASHKFYYQYDNTTDVIIFDFDGKNVCWGGGKINFVEEPLEPISGRYAQWKGDITASWWDDTKYAISCDAYALANTDPSKYAVKFELNVINDWNEYGSLAVTFNEDKYSYEYKPYLVNGQNTPFKTDGWITVTIPLSAFGGGLTDATTLKDCRFKLFVKGDEQNLTNVNILADNLRIVEIKPLN
jgi:hypothetical protein